MVQERSIIAAAMQSRDHFDRIQAHNPRDFLSDIGKIIWKFIEEYYEADSSAKNVDSALIRSRIHKSHPKHAEAFGNALQDYATGVPVSAPNVVLEIQGARKERIGEDIQAALARGDEEKLAKLFSDYLSVSSSEEDSRLYLGNDVSLLTRNLSGKRIPIAPKALNDQLRGGCLSQHHILIFAFTEVGKSFFALNMARTMVQNGFKVLYLQNEEPGEDLHFRFIRSLTELSEEQILADPARAEQIATERGGNLFSLVEMCPGSPMEVERHIRTINPDVFFVDQVKNLSMSGDGRPFDEAIKAMRALGKKYNKLAVSLAQAGDRAYGKRLLAVNDVHDSRVEVPGACDLILGLGGTEDMMVSNRRTISLPKNKISGIKMPVDCVFDMSTMRVK